MRLEEIQRGQTLTGIAPDKLVSVVAAEMRGSDSLELTYKIEGALGERLLSRADEDGIAIATAQRPFTFKGEAEPFQLACEAKRMDLAFLFDPMMAVHTANVAPLPHQITAVYESMLPRQPLRFVLADDPGAGKTIMAGLYIRELIMRADAKRILIVAPGKTVEAERDAQLEPSMSTPAVMLAQLKGIGSQIAATLWSEALYRHFDNRRQVAAYAGLAPTPWKSGSIDHEQGVSKTGNPRLRTTMIQVAWLWTRHQPGSALSQWFFDRVQRNDGRMRKTTIVALARKLLVAFWKYVTSGVVIEGAVVQAA